MDEKRFIEKFCGELNAQQMDAVRSVNGRVLLLAVPGSGKTTVLVTRLGYMVCCAGVSPQNILTMTFTTSAAAEMKERFGKLFGREYAEGITFCTINSLCWKIIRYIGSISGREPFSMLEEADAQHLVRDIYQRVNHEFATESIVKDVRGSITFIKNMNLAGSQIKNEDFSISNMVEIYNQYNHTLRMNRLMDFDDQLVYAYNLLQKFPDVLRMYQNRYPYICVDEAQDTSRIQHAIIRLLSKSSGNLFMVGDEDQSIYGFRGAYPTALLNFKNNFPDAKVLTMEENFRSQKNIISLANPFIAENQFRYQKVIRPTREPDRPVEIIPVKSREDQFAFLLDRLRKKYGETAVLYRNNESAVPLIDLLERNGIPYTFTKKETGFFTHRMVLDIRNIIQFAQDPYNTELFMDLYYKMGLRMTKEAAINACRQSSEKNEDILHVLKNDKTLPEYVQDNVIRLEMVMSHAESASPYTFLGEIWNTLEYKNFAEQRKIDSTKYHVLRILARQEKNCEGFLSRLDELEAVIRSHVNTEDSTLILSTIHSSKGMEFSSVYLLDVLDGILPQESGDEVEDMLQHEEDRRVCYVGITRAKEELHVFDCKDSPSQYVMEMRRVLSGKPLKQSREQNQKRSELRTIPRKPALQIIPEPGLKILHTVYGPGTVQTIRGDLVSIWMEEKGRIMVFSWKKILEQRLLEPRQN